MDPNAMNDSGSDSGSEIMPHYTDFVMRDNNGNIPLPQGGCKPIASSETSSDDDEFHEIRLHTSMSGTLTNKEMNDICPSYRNSSDHNSLTPPDSDPMASPGTSCVDNKGGTANEGMDDPIKLLEIICPSSHNFSDHNPLTPPDSDPMTSPGTSCVDDKVGSVDKGMDDPINRLEIICPSSHNSSDHKPLTPPDSDPMASRGTSPIDGDVCSTETDDSAKRLEKISLSSRKSIDCSTEDKFEEHSFKKNSNGKVKKFKCKRCEFLTYTQVDFWNHIREHIKPDKQLFCPKCRFVTEFKHHLKYHLLLHEGEKPYKCPKCPYRCVSNSMLKSHLKSHSNIYQYRCGECSYASKHCHFLKLHLRKYKHKPGVVLDEGGSPNPQQIIDVYGTRRGTKVKKQKPQSADDTLPLTHMLLDASSQLQMREQQEDLSVPSVSSEASQASPMQDILAEPSTDLSAVPDVLIEPPEFEVNNSGVLVLSKPGFSSIPSVSPKKRREGPSPNNDNSSEDKDEYEGDLTVMYSTVEAIQGDNSDQEVANTTSLKCNFCNLSFGYSVMYTLHMGLHDCDNPFMCSMCGQECEDEISFYMHSVRVGHPRV